MSRRSLDGRFDDIVTSIDRIAVAEATLLEAERSGSGAHAAMALDALLYRLLVIGEAVKALPEDLLAREPDVPWSAIARLRDLLAHHYYRVDGTIVRRTIDDPLRTLAVAVQRLRDVNPTL